MSRRLARLRNQSVVHALSASCPGDCPFGGGASRAPSVARVANARAEFTPRQGDAIDRGDEETRLADFPFLPSGLVRGKTLLGIQRSPTLFPTTLSTQVVTNIIRLYRMQPSFYRVPSSQSPFSFLIDPKRISECRVDEKSSIQNRWKGI